MHYVMEEVVMERRMQLLGHLARMDNSRMPNGFCLKTETFPRQSQKGHQLTEDLHLLV